MENLFKNMIKIWVLSVGRQEFQWEFTDEGLDLLEKAPKL